MKYRGELYLLSADEGVFKSEDYLNIV